MRCSLAILTFLFFSICTFAQNEIQLKNPSFEGTSRMSTTPEYWQDCGFLGESPSDINPNEALGVNHPASDGKTYLGMVTRSNDTYESIAQKLDILLEVGQVYQWEMDLATSKDFFSFDRITRKKANYNEPIVLRIWAGDNYCQQGELLFASEPITNTDWKRHTFEFKPSKNYRYIRLEAYYSKKAHIKAVNGNIQIDNLSAIKKIQQAPRK